MMTTHSIMYFPSLLRDFVTKFLLLCAITFLMFLITIQMPLHNAERQTIVSTGEDVTTCDGIVAWSTDSSAWTGGWGKE